MPRIDKPQKQKADWGLLELGFTLPGQKLTANRYRVSFGVDKNFLKLIVAKLTCGEVGTY